MSKLLVLCLSVWLCAGLTLSKVNKGRKFTNRWVANIDAGEEVAQRVARDLGYTYKGQIGPFEGYYELVREDHPEVSLRHSDHLTRSLQDLDEVKWAKQQRVQNVVYKDFKEDETEEEKVQAEFDKYLKSEANRLSNDPRGLKCKNIFTCIKFPLNFKKKGFKEEEITKLGTFFTRPAPHAQLYTYRGTTKHIQLLSKKISAYEIFFNDPLWRKQWYLQDYRTTDMPVMDHNVVPVYNRGYSGKGVTVAVVDSAIDIDHPDLKQNIDIEKSYDTCQDLPLSQVTNRPQLVQAHGTKCAGIIAMVANNDKCGVGIAYNAKIAGITKYCDNKELTDEDVAKTLVQNLNMVDIYSNSWGPSDDADSVCVLDELTTKSYERGVTEGRGGKGVIYVHSSGNGGTHGDNCATDCTINQPHVIAITSATQWGKKSDYGEECTAIFATTYSGNINRYNGKIAEGTITLSLGGKCDKDFYGTSASCPIASGIFALTLEANSDLSYRDVMHIITRSAEVAPLADNENSWHMNGRGFWVSNKFGFGLLNAENMVILAEGWKTVPKKHTCVVSVKPEDPEILSYNKKVSIPFETPACQDSPDSVVYLEHLEVASTVEYPRRGDIKVSITSPAGTTSVLLEHRKKDTDVDGLEGWSIMSLHNWGENPKGKWNIHIEISDTAKDKKATGLVAEFTIKFHGIGEVPAHLNVQREYAAFRLPDNMNERG